MPGVVMDNANAGGAGQGSTVHEPRNEFIKLLVLSQWSRQAADVSKLIDLQNFIRTRHHAYTGALQWVGDMKRDLVQAQVANPDLKTALEVLSKGKAMSMSDLGYKPPKSFTDKGTLKRLQKINRIISVRLALYDSVPRPFQSYNIHDGRVTFVVPGEFELDLSIGQEDEFSQLYFIDMRFLFTPSSPVPKGRMFNEIDIKINDSLRNNGLAGCFDLHLRVSIEPMSGATIVSTTPSVQDRLDNDRISDKSSVEDIANRVARLRSTSSMDGDNWWVVQLQPAPSAKGHPVFDTSSHNSSVLRSAQVVSGSFSPAKQQAGYPSFADLWHYLSGILTVHANARYLVDLQSVDFYPPLQKLVIESGLHVPDILLRYGVANIPQALRITFPGGLKKRTCIKDTVRLAFHGIDPQKKVAMMVAYGNLLIPTRTFSTLISRWDHSLVFQNRGSGFAIRLLAPSGRPIISELMESLQRLDCVLSIFESLQRKKMEPQSLSLSHVTFAYGPEKDLFATLNIETSTPSSPAELDPLVLASQPESLFHLRLGVSFEFPNPHRRIQDSLESTLNQSATDSGLDAVAELLLLTLPLMRALDQILVNQSRNQPLRMQVTVRNARTFQIHYPTQQFRFQLVASHHLRHMVWTLKELSSPNEGSTQGQLKSKVREMLYNSRGDGWRGLGNGAVAEIDKVGNLLAELDNLFEASGASGWEDLDRKSKSNDLIESGQQSARGDGQIEGVLHEPARVPNSKSTQHNTTHNADIIMID
ncbi:mediator complex subunit [Aspergillus hancockii]|nr:mediator complex subunit [Aspergillus hancockii]